MTPKTSPRLLALVGFICTVAVPRVAAAQSATERGGIHSSCVRQFYDPDMYNWYSFQNVCSYSISVMACGEDQGGCWTMDPIRPGKKDNFGHSRSEVQALGGIVVYVCRAGWIALDGDNQPIDGGRHPFKCKNMNDENQNNGVTGLSGASARDRVESGTTAVLQYEQ